MTQYNKLVVASQMFVEAHERFENATRDIDYITSLMLSGAVCGIVSPLLAQQGKGTFHALLASLFTQPVRESVFRSVYDGLKHAGLKRAQRLPSDDLIVNADLRKEAAVMLEVAREDFSKIIIELHVLDELPAEFVRLIREPIDYVAPDETST